MLRDEDVALLEAYTYGEISQKEEADLRKRLKEDADFATAVRQWEIIEREGFSFEPSPDIQEAVKSALDKAENNAKESLSLSRRLKWVFLGVVLALLAIFAYWQVSKGDQTGAPIIEPIEEDVANNEYAGLVDEYFRHLPSENFLLGSEETLEQRALAAYEARDYATALPLLLETVEMGGDSLNLLYAGVAAVGIGDGGLALICLYQVVDNRELLPYHPEAYFMLTLAHLTESQFEMALQLCNENIGNTFFPYSEIKFKLDER